MNGAAQDLEVAVVGAGQAGLSAAYFLAARGFAPHDEFVVLDANAAPGGAWQHRWRSLRVRDVHGLYPLPGLDVMLDGVDEDAAARDAVAAVFASYEARYDLPVLRPLAVDAVREAGGGSLLITSGERSWRSRTLINATGTWTRPFWPRYPGAERFQGRQLHTADYDGPDEFAGQHVIVVGGGTSAIQHLIELSEVATVTWVTRRPPEWREEPFDERAGREAVARVEEAVAAGRRPSSVVGVTGLYLTPAIETARAAGVLDRSPMFDRLTPDGVAWDDGRHVRADVLLWATGFRHAVDHLAPLGLRGPEGGIRMAGTQVAEDPRIHLLGYGPSASTIGANRAGRAAVRELRRFLGRA